MSSSSLGSLHTWPRIWKYEEMRRPAKYIIELMCKESKEKREEIMNKKNKIIF